MTVSQELREWVASDVNIGELSETAYAALNDYLIWDFRKEVIHGLCWYDRRTFALLVACALEDE